MALLSIALLLPPSTIAAALRGHDAELPAGLTAGLWLFKLLMAFHALVALGLLGWLPRGENEDSRLPPPRVVGVVSVLVVGLTLRLPGLSGGLWYDEIQTLVDYVRQPWGVLLTTFDSTNQHLLYSVTARATSLLGGASAAMLRLPAVVFGVLSLWAALSFGRRWLAPREAWWSAVILTVSYHHIWFSQNARGYTGLLLGALVGSSLMLDLLRGRPATPLRVWGYAVTMALTLLTHVTALVVVAAHAICWLTRMRQLPRGRDRWGPGVALFLAGSVAIMLYAPVLPQLLAAVGASGTGAAAAEWQRPEWFVAEAIAGLMRGVPAGVAVIPLVACVVLAGLSDTWRRDRLVTLMMVLPFAIMAILLLSTGHNMWPRFFFFGAAFAVQWATHGGFVILDRLIPRRALKIGDAGLAVVTIASLALLPRAWTPKQDYPAAVAWLSANVVATDVIVGTEMMELPMNRWLGQRWPIVRTADSLQAIESATTRTWVVTTFPIRLEATAPDLAGHLRAGYRLAHAVPASIGGGAILILQRGNPPNR